MNKYLTVFKISFQEELAYRFNFIMWRVRNILQIFLIFFLWDAVFSSPGKIVFGYDRAKILTYVFGLVIVKAIVLSARAIDVAGEISRGELSNYLVKPLNYFRYWLTRDISSKLLNLAFATIEIIILFFLLKPPFFLQANPIYLFSFVVLCAIALLTYFVFIFLVSSITFWMPQAGWGVQFLFTAVMLEFLSGALFPLDILPQTIQNILNYTPFPYLIFFPLKVYLGQIQGMAIVKGTAISFVWLVGLWLILKSIWSKGLRVYEAYGK